MSAIILSNKHKYGHINIRFEYGYLVYTSHPVTWRHAIRIANSKSCTGPYE